MAVRRFLRLRPDGATSGVGVSAPAPTLTQGASAVATGIRMPDPVRIGTPTVASASDPGFNGATGMWANAAGRLFVRDTSGTKLRAFDESGSQVASIVVAPIGYGVSGDDALARVYHSVDGPNEVRWYDFGLAAQGGSFAINAISRGLLVLPSGNLLVLNDASPFEVREYTSAGAFVATWYTGTASYRPQRAQHDGTWAFVSFYSGFSAANRGVKRFLIADKGFTNANWMPGTFTGAAGAPDLPWGPSAKVAEVLARFVGVVDGKYVVVMQSYQTGMGLFEATSATDPTVERHLAGFHGSRSGVPTYYDSPLSDTQVGLSKVWASTAFTHSVHGFDRRTARAVWTLTGFNAAAVLKHVTCENFDPDRVRVQYRVGGSGAFTTVTPNDGSELSVAIADPLEVSVDLNTWRGFGSNVLGPMIKDSPVADLGVYYDDPEAPPQPVLCDPPLRVSGNLGLDTGRSGGLRLT